MFGDTLFGGLFGGRTSPRFKPSPAAIVTAVVRNSLDRQDVPIERKDVSAATAVVVKDLKQGLKANKAAIVPVKSAWASKINWTQFAGPLASVAVIFGLNITGDQIVAVVVGFQALQSVLTWVLRTWFTKDVTAASMEQ